MKPHLDVCKVRKSLRWVAGLGGFYASFPGTTHGIGHVLDCTVNGHERWEVRDSLNRSLGIRNSLGAAKESVLHAWMDRVDPIND